MESALAGVPLVEHEVVSVRESLGRVLAADLRSRLDIPPFNKAAMDGYAVCANDERDEYKLMDTVAAGSQSSVRLEPGGAIKVMTGAPVPDGSGRVIILEHVEERERTVQVKQHSTSANICLQAEDLHAGDVFLERGKLIGAVELANMVSCGVVDVEVYRRIRLALISTGDELVESPEQLAPGKIINSNGPLLKALATENGFDVVSNVTVGDDLEQTTAAIEQAVDRADIAVLSGGVSAGEFDYVPQAIECLGMCIHFARLAVKPGKPTTFASGEGRILLGLPGNPVAVYLMFHLFVLRAAGYLRGIKQAPRIASVRLASDITRKPGDRLEFVPCRLTEEGLAELLPYHGSAHQAALMRADGLAAIPAEAEELPAGTSIKLLPLRLRWMHD
jgi:molybdopterin molybdotransferase